MGTIAEKGQYTLEAIDLIQERINNLGGNVTNTTPLKDFATELFNVYNLLPKTEFVEGTNIDLGKTTKAKLDYENDIVGYGNAEQEGTPTPDTPIPISVVTGEQEVEVRGKNLYNAEGSSSGSRGGITYTYNNDGTFTANGTSTGAYWNTIARTFKAGTYTFSGYNSGAYNQDRMAVYLKLASESSHSNKGAIYNGGKVTLTLEEDFSVYFGLVVQSGTTVENAIFRPQIESGDTATTYEPYITPITTTIDLGNLELAKIGDYADEIVYDLDEDKFYKQVNISKKIINTSNVTIFAYNDTNKYVNISKTSLNIPKGATIGTTLCSHFREVTNATDFVVGTYRNNGNVDNLWIKMPDTITTIQEAQAYLNSYNAIFYGTIRTETTEEITDITLIEELKNLYNMQSVNGTTIIEVNGNLPLILKVRGVKGE